MDHGLRRVQTKGALEREPTSFLSPPAAVFAVATDSVVEGRSAPTSAGWDIRGLVELLEAILATLLVLETPAPALGAVAGGIVPALFSCPLFEALFPLLLPPPSETEAEGVPDGAISMLAIKDCRIYVLTRKILKICDPLRWAQ
jgi:hypothetical protein